MAYAFAWRHSNSNCCPELPNVTAVSPPRGCTQIWDKLGDRIGLGNRHGDMLAGRLEVGLGDMLGGTMDMGTRCGASLAIGL